VREIGAAERDREEEAQRKGLTVSGSRQGSSKLSRERVRSVTHLCHFRDSVKPG
jgi:hypothetical protein